MIGHEAHPLAMAPSGHCVDASGRRMNSAHGTGLGIGSRVSACSHATRPSDLTDAPASSNWVMLRVTGKTTAMVLPCWPCSIDLYTKAVRPRPRFSCRLRNGAFR